MRKLISLGLATAMVASMAVSAFAEEAVVDTAKANSVSISLADVTESTPATTVKVNGRTFSASGTAQERVVALASAIDKSTVGANYDIYVHTTASAEIFVVKDATENKLELFAKSSSSVVDVEVTNATVAAVTDEDKPANNEVNLVVNGDWQNDYTVILTPVALAEKDDWNGKDGIKPGKKLYFKINDPFSDLDLFKFDVSKGENAKQIKKVSVIEKRFGDGLYDMAGEEGVAPGTRATVVQVELVDNMTDKEFKVSFDLKVKVDAKDGITIGGVLYKKGAASKKFEEIMGTWMYNTTETTDDREFTAGTGGIMVKPVKNEENTVTWVDNNRDLAKLTFTADSDVAKYFPKLSTKWPNATYAQLFDDQDAFVFDFVGNPAISSTSRAVLELYCPFIDDEDEYTIDPESVVIYQVADDATLAASTEVELAKAILDGRLIDVTDKFTAGENEDGDFVYTTKTRTLGTYIIAEKAPSEEAFDEAEDEGGSETPTEDTGKTNPGTGR